MRPIQQTIIGPQGNCYAACVASILEIDIHTLPVPREEEQGIEGWRLYMGRLNGQLIRDYNIWIQNNLTFGEDNSYPYLPGYHICSIRSPRVDGSLHAVVAKDGKIVWDPHPEKCASEIEIVCWDLVCQYDASLTKPLSRTMIVHKMRHA